MNAKNIEKVKRSIIDEPNDWKIMSSETDGCGSPCCILGHCKHIMRAEGLNTGYEEAASYLDIGENQLYQIYAPKFSFAHYEATTADTDCYITKGHVIRMLDLLIAGEEDVEEAWRNSREGEAP